MTTQPDPTAEWWTTTDVAAYLGVQIGTVSSYRQRQQMPAPDSTYGRTHLWRPARIIEWHGHRPRRGSSDEAGAASRVAGRGHPPIPGDDLAAQDAAEASRWVVHGRRNLYDSRWIRLDLVDIEQPGGQRFEHHAVEMPAAAMTALLDDSQTKILLLWRHRFAPNLWNWELPGGLIDGDEQPEETAAREIQEETGYRPRSLERIVDFEPMVGMVHCPHYILLGRGAEWIGNPTEKNEMAWMRWVPLADLPALIDAGEIKNSGTLVATLHVLALSGPTASHRS